MTQTNNAEWEVRLKIQFEQRMQDMTDKEKDRIRFWYQSVLDFFSEAISQEKEKWNIALKLKFMYSGLGVRDMVDEFIKESDNLLQRKT